MSINQNFLVTETAKARTELETWVKQMAAHCDASTVHWCDGSQEEYDNLCGLLEKKEPSFAWTPKKDPIALPASATRAMWPV